MKSPTHTLALLRISIHPCHMHFVLLRFTYLSSTKLRHLTTWSEVFRFCHPPSSNSPHPSYCAPPLLQFVTRLFSSVTSLILSPFSSPAASSSSSSSSSSSCAAWTSVAVSLTLDNLSVCSLVCWWSEETVSCVKSRRCLMGSRNLSYPWY